MPLWLQVALSAFVVATVLWFMFRMPGRSDALVPWGAPLALLSVWLGVAAVVLSALLWVVQYRDIWITVVLLVLDPGTLAAGVLVLWIHRHGGDTDEVVRLQCLQAKVAIVLGFAAVVVGYVYVLGHKAPFTPVGGV